MKHLFVLSLLLMFLPVCGFSQDSIFMINGKVISAKILGMNLDYVYFRYLPVAEHPQNDSVAKMAVIKVVYEGGLELVLNPSYLKKDFAESKRNEFENVDYTVKKKLFLGWKGSVINQYKLGNTKQWWSYINQGNNPDPPATSPFMHGISLKMAFGGDSYKIMFVDDFSVLWTQKDAINGSVFTPAGKNEFAVKSLFIQVGLGVLYPFFPERKLHLGLSTNLLIGLNTGNIDYAGRNDEVFCVGMGFQPSFNADYNLFKKIWFTNEFSYRMIRVSEFHSDPTSSTGWSYYKVDATGLESLKFNWGGFCWMGGLSLMIEPKKKKGN